MGLFLLHFNSNDFLSILVLSTLFTHANHCSNLFNSINKFWIQTTSLKDIRYYIFHKFLFDTALWRPFQRNFIAHINLDMLCMGVSLTPQNAQTVTKSFHSKPIKSYINFLIHTNDMRLFHFPTKLHPNPQQQWQQQKSPTGNMNFSGT